MHRFHLPPAECRGSTIQLDEAGSRHAATVLRVQAGEVVTVLDGEGVVLRCEVAEVRKKSVRLEVCERDLVPPRPHRVTLLQAIPKGQLIESIIQKATELGAHCVVPLFTERVTIHLGGDQLADKAEKWRRVAIEAIKQSGCAWLPRIETPVTPDEFLARRENLDLPLIASLQPGSRHAGGYFREFEAKAKRKPVSVAIWVGPEGDFTEHEVKMVIEGGARPITLGSQILRCETAATCCLAIVNHELDAPIGTTEDRWRP